ncbi:MAG: STT3 domain-containing protein, partial [Candidatus Hydrothermarchaeaceae archaeon]
MGKGSKAILAGIFLLAIAFRLVTLKSGYLLGNDPWAHYVSSRQVLSEGSYLLHSLLSYSIYPHEAYVKVPAGLDYFPFYLYSAVSFTGISFYETFRIIPSIFGSFSILPLYLLVREFYSEKTALFSAFLLAITPAGIERGFSGFYRGDVFMVFLMLFAFYFFTVSVKRNLFYAPISGIFLFLCAFFWDGWPFAFATLFLAFALGMIFEWANSSRSNSHRLIISHTVACGVGLFLIYVFKHNFYAFSFRGMVWEGFRSEIELVFTLFIFASSFAALHFMPQVRTPGSRMRMIAFASIPLLLLVIVALYGQGYISKLGEFIGNFGKWSSSFIPRTIEAQNIVELQKPSLEFFLGRFASLILLAPLGILLLKKTQKNALPMALAISSIYVLSAATRFSFLASPGISILAAVSITYILSQNWRAVMAACITLLMLLNSNVSIDFAENYEPIVYDELFEALEWLKDETQEESIVLTWWSYSGPVQAIADRKTLFGTYPSIDLMGDVGRMFITSDENTSLDIAKTLKVDYILVDKHVYDLTPNYMLYTDEPHEPFNSTLFNLYRGEPLDNFDLVFKNDRVKIYKPLYNFTRIQDVKTKRRFFLNNEKVDIRVEIKSNWAETARLKVQVHGPEGAELFSKESGVLGTSKINTAFLIPSNPKRGTYLIASTLFDSNNDRVPPTVYRTFVVTDYKFGSSDVIIEADTRYEPESGKLKIGGTAKRKGAPLANEELFVWQTDEPINVKTNENGEFEVIIKDFKWNKAFYIYTQDKSGFVIVFASIHAELTADIKANKYNVKRGENVEITYSVKNNADFPFEGYLSIDDVKLDNN